MKGGGEGKVGSHLFVCLFVMLPYQLAPSLHDREDCWLPFGNQHFIFIKLFGSFCRFVDNPGFNGFHKTTNLVDFYVLTSLISLISP